MAFAAVVTRAAVEPSGVQPQVGPELRGRASEQWTVAGHLGGGQGLCCAEIMQLMC